MATQVKKVTVREVHEVVEQNHTSKHLKEYDLTIKSETITIDPLREFTSQVEPLIQKVAEENQKAIRYALRGHKKGDTFTVQIHYIRLS